MKKSNLPLKSRSPFKKGNNDLNNSIEYFHKEITKIITKHPLDPQQELLSFFEKELAKCKDGIDTWIKGSALNALGYSDFGNKFLQKATELGYSVDTVMEGKSEFSRQLLNIKMILKNLMKHSEGNSEVVTALNMTMKQVENLNALIFKKLVNENLQGKKIKLISINENVENIEPGTEGTITNHDTEADIISVQWDNGKESVILPEDQFELLPTKESHEHEGAITDVSKFIEVFFQGTPPTEEATRKWESDICATIKLLFNNDIALTGRVLMANAPQDTEWTQQDIETYLNSICKVTETFSVGPEGLNMGTDTKMAVKRLINSVWTLVYKQVDENSIKIISYDRENPIGIEKERELPLCELIEDDQRTVTGAKIQERNNTGFNSGWVDKDRPFDTFTVVNPKYVFSYEGLTEGMTSTNKPYVLIFSDGVQGMISGNTEQQLISDILKKPNVREWAIYKNASGFHSTTQDEYLVRWWGQGTYWDNVSKKQPELLSKKYNTTNENLTLNPENGKAELPGLENTTMSNIDVTSQSKQPLENDKEYLPNALINFINDNPFYKYSFHETSTDDMEKDLDKFFKHYVKGDEEVMKKYKIYEKYKNK